MFLNWKPIPRISLIGHPSYNPAVPKKPDRYHVGDQIKANMPSGKIVPATIKAIIETTGGAKYQVDFGHDQTALIDEWQIVKDEA